jgi:nitroreductase/FMN reductase [NAD(P)H]
VAKQPKTSAELEDMILQKLLIGGAYVSVRHLLNLPDHVFPVAGLAVGYPDELPPRSFRLPLPVTVHHNSYADDTLDTAIEGYDRRRAVDQPYRTQRYVEEFGHSENYGWSEDKARQYTCPERQDFGAYVKRIGVKLE